MIGDIGVGIVWLAVLLLRAVRVQTSPLSDFELQRRVGMGDQKAKQKLTERRWLSDELVLKKLLVDILLIIAVSLTLLRLGWWLGVLAAIILVIALRALAARRSLQRLTRQLWSFGEPSLQQLVVKLHLVLRWLHAAPDHHSAVPQFASRDEFIESLHHDTSLPQEERSQLLKLLAAPQVLVRDTMTPLRKLVTLAADDTLGPLLLDRLHKEERGVFPVMAADGKPAGLLFMNDALRLMRQVPSVAEAMRPDVGYLPASMPLSIAFRVAAARHQPLYLVVDASAKIVGSVTLEQMSNHLLGRTLHKVDGDFFDHQAVSAMSSKPQ